MSTLADELLAAHVEHEVARLRGSLSPIVGEHVKAAFTWFEDVRLGEVVTQEQILGVIQRYVVDLRVSGGITELAGQMAHVVYSSPVGAETRLSDIMAPETYDEFADKVTALRDVPRELLRSITSSAAFEMLSARVLSRIVVALIFGRDGDGRGHGRGHGHGRGDGDGDEKGSPLRHLVLELAQKVAPGFEQNLVAALSQYVEQHAGRLTRDAARHLIDALDPEWLREVVDDLWENLSRRRLAEAGTVFTPQDLEDFVVLGLEFWLKFRKTPYFRRVTAEVVGHLFAKYGEESVASVIQDMGVTERMVIREVETFLGPALEHAHRTGFLEERLRAHLEPFYRSERLTTLLAR